MLPHRGPAGAGIAGNGQKRWGPRGGREKAAKGGNLGNMPDQSRLHLPHPSQGITHPDTGETQLGLNLLQQ